MSNLAMNDTADDTPVVLTPADAVRVAQERLDAAIQATKRARGVRDGAQVRVAKLQALEADAVQRDTETLRAWTLAGNWHEAPAPTADPQHLQDVASASHRLRTANANLALFEKAEVDAREQLGAAERAWRAFQNARLTAEADRIVARIDEAHREMCKLFALIAALDINHRCATGGTLLSPTAKAMLNNPIAAQYISALMVDGNMVFDINTPINQQGKRPAALDEAQKYWDEFSADGM